MKYFFAVFLVLSVAASEIDGASLSRGNQTNELPSDAWPVPSLSRSYETYNSPRGVYRSQKINGTEHADLIEGHR